MNIGCHVSLARISVGNWPGPPAHPGTRAIMRDLPRLSHRRERPAAYGRRTGGLPPSEFSVF